ncbi:hypothetical protein ACFL37_01000 [Candidatus Margulisiibacteriota bacterium]
MPKKETSLARPVQRKGISLVTSLIIIVIIVIALFPLLRALSISLFVSSDTESTMVASNHLQAKMEEIRTLPFVEIVAEARAPIASDPKFQREVTVISPHYKLKNIKVTVYWQGADGKEQSLFLETYATNY